MAWVSFFWLSLGLLFISVRRLCDAGSSCLARQPDFLGAAPVSTSTGAHCFPFDTALGPIFSFSGSVPIDWGVCRSINTREENLVGIEQNMEF